MKKTFIICGIVAAILICIGIILLIVGSTFGFVGNIYSDESFTSQQDVSRLKIDVAAGNAKVSFYDGENVQIEYQTHSKYGFVASESNGTVKLEQPHNTWWINWGWGMRRAPTATVKIPYAFILDLDIEISAGAVDVESGTFGKLTADVSAGKLDFKNIVCAEAICNISAGNLSVDGMACTSLDCDVSAGNASFTGVTCSDIDIDVSAGSLYMMVVGKKDDYSISVSKSAGSCNQSTQHVPNAVKRITIDVSAGSVTVNFI